MILLVAKYYDLYNIIFQNIYYHLKKQKKNYYNYN